MYNDLFATSEASMNAYPTFIIDTHLIVTIHVVKTTQIFQAHNYAVYMYMKFLIAFLAVPN